MSELEQVLSVSLDGKLKASVKADAIKSEAFDELQDIYCALRQELDPKLAALKIQQKELADVEESLLAALDSTYKPHEDGVRKTEKYLLSFAAKGKATTITDKKKLIEILGLDAYLAMAEISITDMKKYLTAAQVKLVATEVHKNKRRLTYAPV